MTSSHGSYGEAVRGTGERKRHWTDERMRDELVRFLGDRTEWPSEREFKQAGQGALLSAIRRHGGAGRWAEAVGLVAPGRGAVVRWSDGRVLAELRAFVSDRAVFPSESDFARAGKRPLLRAAIAHGGLERWAAELGCTVRTQGRPELWPEERIRRELAPFVANGRWPTEKELRQAGRLDLHAAIQRRGGAAHWARRLGLPVRTPGTHLR
jgi:hypothetical protein